MVVPAFIRLGIRVDSVGTGFVWVFVLLIPFSVLFMGFNGYEHITLGAVSKTLHVNRFTILKYTG